MTRVRPCSAPLTTSHEGELRRAGSSRARPASAGFVGAFRAVVRTGSQQIRPRTPHRSRTASKENEHPVECDGVPCKQIPDMPAKAGDAIVQRLEAFTPAKYFRPCSAPNARWLPRRIDCEKEKHNSEWALLARHGAQLEKEQEFLKMREKQQLVAEQQEDLKARLAHEAKSRNQERKRQKAELKAMQVACEAERQRQAGEQEMALRQRLDAKTFIQCQVQEQRERCRKQKAQQLHEETLERQECKRLIAEDKAEKERAKERRRQMNHQASVELAQQVVAQKQAAKESAESEKQLVADYERTVLQQEAAREAKLREREESVARRMAAGMGIQEQQNASSQAFDDRIEQQVQAKYAADDAKAKMDALARGHLKQDLARHRKEQLDHNEQLDKSKREEEQLLVKELAAQEKAEKEQLKAREAGRIAREVNLQRDLLAKIIERRALVPLDMTDVERQLNRASLKMACQSDLR